MFFSVDPDGCFLSIFTFIPPPGPVISVPFHSRPKPQLLIAMLCLAADWYNFLILYVQTRSVACLRFLSLRVTQSRSLVHAGGIQEV